MNFLAIFVAALVPMVLGFIWYNPKVFGTVWLKSGGINEEKTKQGNMALKIGLSFLFSFMIAFILNAFVVHDSFIEGAIYYKTDHGSVKPEAGSELANWVKYYNDNLAADNHIFTHGAFHAFFLIGLFLVLPLFATNAIFEGKGAKYVMVNVGYWMLSLTIMGGIIAAWR